ncbi:MAG: NUDIX domain-containing protein [bacterium]|nr:NUDIX domain-containing protein [bacterium]
MQAESKVKLEFSAGGIVFRRAARGGEMAFIEDPWHKWTFAKGHIEKGEKPEEAAVREVSEEMGAPKKFFKIVAPLGRIDWWFRQSHTGRFSPKGSLIHKFVYYFLMQVPMNVQFKPQAKELIYSIKWVPLDEALKLSSYKDVKPVLQKAIKFLNNLSLRGGTRK